MCEKTCGDCKDFWAKAEECGNPFVYLNHTTNVYKTTATTEACGVFYPIKKDVQEHVR